MDKDRKLEEMKFIRERAEIVLKFQMSQYKVTLLVDAYNTTLKNFKEQSGNTKYYRGFKEAFRDMLTILKDMPIADYNKLNAKLKKKFNGNPYYIENQYNAISSILKRNKIRNEYEYRLVEDYIELIYNDKGKANEIKELNTMLLSFMRS